jgi:hypothetical protein
MTYFAITKFNTLIKRKLPCVANTLCHFLKSSSFLYVVNSSYVNPQQAKTEMHILCQGRRNFSLYVWDKFSSTVNYLIKSGASHPLYPVLPIGFNKISAATQLDTVKLLVCIWLF